MLRFGLRMDRVRHQADSLGKYNSYFDLLHQKREQRTIQPRLTYNMDEKGFSIGEAALSKRVFGKAICVKDGVRGTTQDGNRQWITIIPTIYADGTTLPTSIIYPSEGYNILDHWIANIPAEDDQVTVTSTPTGWTNDKLGIAWIQRFDKLTKKKAGRSWRLLICDGHSTHVTMDFPSYATRNRMLVMVFPSHSTHTLQPLDVGVFGPLSSYYSSELSRIQQQSQGLLSVRKSRFLWLIQVSIRLILHRVQHH
jgi:hypothetical protein